MTDINAIDDVLLEAELHVGDPDRRRDLAAKLLSQGLSAPEIDDLAGYARKAFSSAKRSGGLVNLLLDRDRRNLVLADLDKVARLKAGKRKVAPGSGDWVTPDSPDSWDESDFARRVYCRVHGDGAAIETVAEEFGLHVVEARQLLKLGSEHRRTDLPDWASQQTKSAAAGLKVHDSMDTEKLHKERTEKFVRDMRARKLTAEGTPPPNLRKL